MLSPEFIAGIEDALRAEGLQVEGSAPTEIATFYCSATSGRFLLFVCDGTLFVRRDEEGEYDAFGKLARGNPKFMRFIVQRSRSLRGFQLADPACFEKVASEIKTKAGAGA